jgi:acyl-CoA synthetase (AMP-forming)/AMP-acid ligase II
MDLLIGDIFRSAARAVPDRVAAALDGEQVTFGELDRAANRTARALTALGVTHGTRVVSWAATTLDQLAPFAALAKLGAVFAPIAAALNADEATPVAATAEPTLLLADDDHAEAAAVVAGRLGIPSIPFAELRARAETLSDDDVVCAELRETDPHIVFFTSGSTGRPKGVVLSHRVNFLRAHPGGLAPRRGTLVCMFQLFHMAGWTMALQQWHGRGTIVFVRSADAVTLCDAVERHRAERLYCIPAVWRRILDHLASPDGATRDLSCVRAADTGTSATPPELLAALTSALPDAEVRVFYGSTEAGGVATLEHADLLRKPGSCGLPTPFADVRLADDGELCVRSPLLFDGYLNNETATAEALRDGWFHTGDLAEVDADGYFTIVGRTKDIIRTGGEAVAPVEVELVLSEHALVGEVAVVGVPDPQWGEVVCAVVVARDSTAPPTLDDLRAHCRGRLAPFKHPRRLELTDAIPRTPSTGQVQRRLLIERFS